MNLSILKPAPSSAPLKTFVVKFRDGSRVEVVASNYVLDSTGWWQFSTMPIAELNKFLMSGRAFDAVFQVKATFVHSIEEKGAVVAVLSKPRAKPKAKPRAKKAAKK